jgi:hypothetical protein
MNNHQAREAARLAALRIADGASPDDLGHVIYYPDGSVGISTPLPAGSDLAGYTETYYTLRTLLQATAQKPEPSIADVDGYLKMIVTAKHPITGKPVNVQVASFPCFFSQREEAIAQLEKEQGPQRMEFTKFIWKSHVYF